MVLEPSKAVSIPEKKFSITYIVDNVSLVERFKIYRKEETHFNIPWVLSFHRNPDSVFIYLDCLRPHDNAREWSINTKMEFQLLSENGSIMSSTYYRPFGRSVKSTGYHHSDFIKWDLLMKLYMVDNKVTFRVNVTILDMKGITKNKLKSFDNSNYSDVVLKVGDEQFHVLKAYLALQSTYFEKLLLGNFEEATQSEVVLKDVDVEDFQSFLELLHGESSIDEENIEGILHLADMYDSRTAIRRCEEFLFEKSELELTEKLRLVSKYNCQGLKETILSRVINKSEIDKVLSDDVCKTDPSIAVVLLQKKLENVELLESAKPIEKASFFSWFRSS